MKYLVIFFLLLVSILNGQQFKEGLQLYTNGELKKAAVIFHKIYKSKVKKELRGKAFFYFIKTQKSSSSRVREYSKFLGDFSTHILFPRAVLNLALIYMNMNKYSLAITLLKNFDKKDKLWPMACLRLGQLYFKEKKYKQALLAFNSLLAFKGINSFFQSKAYFGMGLTYERNSQPQKAELVYLNILNKHLKESEVPATLYRLGNLSYDKKDWRMANDWFSKLLKNYPNSFEAYLAKGKLLILRAHLKSPNTQIKNKGEILVYEIQIAAYRHKKYAELYLKKIKKTQSNVFIFIQENKMFSLRIGFFKSRWAAEQKLANLKKLGIDGFIRTRKILLTETNFGR